MTIRQYIEKEGLVNFEKILTVKGKEKVNYPNFIITDTRFENELEAVKKRGGITIRVNRKPIIIINNMEYIIGIDEQEHSSETALDNEIFDYEIVNDGTISDLIDKIRIILIENNLINVN